MGESFTDVIRKEHIHTMTSGLELYDVAGVPIASTTLDDAVDRLLDAAEHGTPAESIRFINAFSVVSAHRRPEYLRTIRGEGVSYPDGTPVAVALRLVSGARSARRVRGPSFFESSLRRSGGRDVRHFLLGTTDATLARLTDRVTRLWPDVMIAGAYAPPFGESGRAAIDEWARAIHQSGANCIWVALGTPKQDLVATALAQRLGVPVAAVGAAFDFVAATKHEAPVWMQRAGLEWIFRLATEPRRLWRRYLVGNLVFLTLLAVKRNGPTQHSPTDKRPGRVGGRLSVVRSRRLHRRSKA